jgi:alanyl-tRNA synthetase
MCKDIEQAKINSKEFDTLVKETNYEVTSKNLLSLRKRFIDITASYRQLMFAVNKQQSGNEVESIKQIKKHLSKSKHVYYFTYNGSNNKVINQALTELANEDHEHAFVIINNTGSKIQYIAIAAKDFVNKHSFNSNLLIKSLNELTKGSGGGRNEFAQGGTSELKLLDKIVKHIESI